MIIDFCNWNKLPTQEKVYYDKSETVVFSAGLGCFSEKSILHTINGDKNVGDIVSPQIYYSKNDQDQLSLYPGTSPYLKGKDSLYRVIHERGEFEVTLSHQIYVGGGNYRSLGEVMNDSSQRTYYIPCPTNRELDLISSPSSVQHLEKIALDFLNHYGSCIHQYGQRLPKVKDIYQSFFPLQFDAHTFDQTYRDLLRTSRMDDQEGLKLTHSHLFESISRICKMDYKHLPEGLASVSLIQEIFSKYFEHIYQYNHCQLSLQSPDFSSLYPRDFLSKQYHTYEYYPYKASSSSNSLSKIIKIEKLKEDWIFDVHVFGSNNYLMGGVYHHNSGKTHLMCRKALQLSALNRGFSGGLLAPTYADYKKDIYEEMIKILEDDLKLIKGKHYEYHATDKVWRFCWNKKPLFVFTAEKPIAGPNLAYMLVNEFSLIPYERIKEALRRVRIKEAPRKQKGLFGTPEDVHGWLEEYVETMNRENELNPGSFALHFADTRENIHLDESYRRHLETMLDDQALRVFAGGQIVRIGGNYFYYSFNPQINIKKCEYDPNLLIHCGLDFNVGMMSATFSHRKIEDGKDKLKIFAELVLEGDSDTPKMIKAIEARYPKEKILITCDASGNSRKTSGISDVQMLRSANLNVRFKAVNSELRKRQLNMNRLFSHEQIDIDPSCKRTIIDFKTVRQNKYDFSKDKKDPKKTHLSDGVDYVCDFEYPFDIDRKSKQINF